MTRDIIYDIDDTPEARRKLAEFINTHELGMTEDGRTVYLADQFMIDDLLLVNHALVGLVPNP